MLNWSLYGYKFTLGLGSLGLTGLLSEMWVPALPFWIVLIIVGTPLLIFVFADPEFMPLRAARRAQGFASVWYVAVAIGTWIAATLNGKPLPHAWPLFLVFTALGVLPCAIVLHRAFKNACLPPTESDEI